MLIKEFTTVIALECVCTRKWLERGKGELLGVMGIFFILFWVMVTVVYTFVKSERTENLQSVHFLKMGVLYKNRKMQRRKYFEVTRTLRGSDVLANSKFSYFSSGLSVLSLSGVPGKTSFTYKTHFCKTKPKVTSLPISQHNFMFCLKWCISPNQSYSVLNVIPCGISSLHKPFLWVLFCQDTVPWRSWDSLLTVSPSRRCTWKLGLCLTSFWVPAQSPGSGPQGEELKQQRDHHTKRNL